MDEKVCCVKESQKCVADYEKETSDVLVETRAVLASIYFTMSADNYSSDDTGTPNCLMENVVANKELAMQIRDMAKDINRILFNN